MNDRTLTQLAPSGLFLGNNTLTSNGTYFINCSNPLLSAQEAATICTPIMAGVWAWPGVRSGRER